MDDGFAVWVCLADEQRTEGAKPAGQMVNPRSVGARRLRAWIDNHHGMTPEKFGQWLKPPVHKRKVQRWLSGHGKPSIDEADQIQERTKIRANSWARYRQVAE